MRPRNRKHLDERFDRCSHLVVESPQLQKGKWHEAAGRALHLEIGCGKGAFVTGMALAHPETDFVAMECVKTVILAAMEKAEALQLPNVRFIYGYADGLRDYFDEGEIDRIYLNFSDPWPKKRYWKNRLTHPRYLEIYTYLLSQGACIWQKTDNLELFEFSIESFSSMNYVLSNVCRDLHASDFGENVMTEYEARFVSLGQPIYRLEASKP